jgi:hypothetical protein
MKNSRGFWTLEKDQIIRDRYPIEGALILAQYFGTTYGSVVSRASRLKVRHEQDHQARVRKIAENKDNVDIDYFSRSENNNQVYDVGYIWADGSIKNAKQTGTPCVLALECTKLDEEIILGIRSRLKSLHAITNKPESEIYSEDTDKWYVRKPTVLCQICNHLLLKPLVEKEGISANKSNLDLPYLKTCSDSFLPHRIRGYFDGDGCFSMCGGGIWEGRFQLLGSPSFVRGLSQELCRLTDLILPRPEDRGKIIRFSWSSRLALEKIYNFLYPSGQYPYLRRKREKFEAVLRVSASQP